MCPLLRNVEDLFLVFFALSCLGAVLVCLGCHDRYQCPTLHGDRYGRKSFRALMD